VENEARIWQYGALNIDVGKGKSLRLCCRSQATTRPSSAENQGLEHKDKTYQSKIRRTIY